MVTPREVFRSRAFIEGAVQSVLWIALGVALMHLATSYAKIFMDFRCELPDLTIVVLNLSYFLTHYCYLGLLPILLWPLVNWGALSALSPNPISQTLWRVATWSLPLVCTVLVVFAIICPLVNLVVKLSR
jgi:hypothetical protein